MLIGIDDEKEDNNMHFEKEKELKEAPLGYWEKESYMIIIPKEATRTLLDGIVDRVAQIEGVEIKEKTALTEQKVGRMKINYENEDFEIGYYPSSFSLPNFYLDDPNYYFSKGEKEEFKNAKASLTLFMKFNKDAKKSYHLQLKLAVAMVPNLIGVMDESAEKLLPKAWVEMTAKSKILPGSKDLYTVHAVTAENGEVWLHTHGLCRCDLTELEVLNSNKENYNSHYELITTFASYLIDKKIEFEGSAYIGALLNGQPIVVTYLPWTEGLSEYKEITLGGIEDRQDGHNSRTSIIFLYKNGEDEKKKKRSKISIFNDFWNNNPLFFISNEETARMKELAMERFSFVKEAFNNKENKIIIKIGLPVDNESQFEHIWFELLAFEGDRFKARLTQEPYDVENMHEGDIGWYTVQDVTDWTIYTPSFPVTPGTAYLLMK